MAEEPREIETHNRQCNAMHRRFFCAKISPGGDRVYTSPGYYQSPYTQPAQNPYMDRLAQMQPPPQPRDGLIRVTGMEGARAYQMPPNSAVALFDGGQDVFYVKTTDGAGFPTIRAYSFQPMEQAQAAPDYVTRAEFEQLKEMIAHGKQSVSADATDAK